MKIVCVYHSIDLDGWMSAAIVKYWFVSKYGKDHLEYRYDVITKNTECIYKGAFENLKLDYPSITFIGYNYGQPIPDLSEFDKVIMCDISFPKDVMRSLFDKLDNNLIWIDHHISAFKELIDEPIDIEDYSTLFNGLRRTDYAACELTWKYFMEGIKGDPDKESIENPMPEIVRLLGRYDCFGHKGTDEEQKVLEFQYGARQAITNYEEAYKYLHKHIEASKGAMLSFDVSIEGILNRGKAIYQYLCTEAKQTYKNGFKIGLGQSSVKLVDLATIPDTEPETLKNAVGTFLPYKFICINKERFNPINFGIDYHKNGYDGCACFHFDGTHWCFSLYNDNGKVDCSVIAKQFGGGGHKGAAGFRLNNEDFNKFIFNNTPITYCIKVRRRGIGEEDCILHHKFANPPTKEDIEAYLISEDIGYDSKYCSYDFYQI